MVTVGYSAVTPLKVASNLTVTEVTHFFDVLFIYIYILYITIFLLLFINYFSIGQIVKKSVRCVRTQSVTTFH